MLLMGTKKKKKKIQASEMRGKQSVYQRAEAFRNLQTLRLLSTETCVGNPKIHEKQTKKSHIYLTYL